MFMKCQLFVNYQYKRLFNTFKTQNKPVLVNMSYVWRSINETSAVFNI